MIHERAGIIFALALPIHDSALPHLSFTFKMLRRIVKFITRKISGSNDDDLSECPPKFTNDNNGEQLQQQALFDCSQKEQESLQQLRKKLFATLPNFSRKKNPTAPPATPRYPPSQVLQSRVRQLLLKE
jgi:hypothetical protein